MTRDEALARAEQLNRERAEDDPSRWMTQRGDGGEWRVVRVTTPGLSAIRPIKGTVEAKPKPPQADDPRTANFRNVGPFGGAG